jgi:MFS family permease
MMFWMKNPPSDHEYHQESPDVSPSRIAWLVVALLVPVALLNYLDRQMLAAMKSSMMGDIPDIATRANWGIVLGSFKWVYAILSPAGGYLADRLSRIRVITASLFVWSAVTWTTGHVQSFPQLVAARALMGISEALYIPAALALVTSVHRGGTRSRAVGLHQIGIYAGIILGGFSGYVADNPSLGWRSAFEACGLIGVVYSIPLYLILTRLLSRDRRTGSNRRLIERANGGENRVVSPLAAVLELFGDFNYVLLVIYFTLPALAGWIVKDWMPDILKEQFALGQGKAGLSAVFYVQFASLVGVGAGGWLADWWNKRSNRGDIYVSALGMSFFLPALFGVGTAGTLGVAIGFLILFGIGWGFFDCNNMPILCRIVKPDLRATGYGLMNLVSISCGGFADWGFGALRDRHVPLAWIFGVFASFAIVSVGVVLMIRPRSKELPI